MAKEMGNLLQLNDYRSDVKTHSGGRVTVVECHVIHIEQILFLKNLI